MDEKTHISLRSHELLFHFFLEKFGFFKFFVDSEARVRLFKIAQKILLRKNFWRKSKRQSSKTEIETFWSFQTNFFIEAIGENVIYAIKIWFYSVSNLNHGRLKPVFFE